MYKRAVNFGFFYIIDLLTMYFLLFMVYVLDEILFCNNVRIALSISHNIFKFICLYLNLKGTLFTRWEITLKIRFKEKISTQKLPVIEAKYNTKLDAKSNLLLNKFEVSRICSSRSLTWRNSTDYPWIHDEKYRNHIKLILIVNFVNF